MLRILQPILQLQRGSASAGLSHKTRAKNPKKTNESPEGRGQLSPDYPEAIVVAGNEPMSEAEASQGNEGLNIEMFQIRHGSAIWQ
ncbi:MAG: hypothetical protein FD166_3625 [Bacteroidetes bacterium]|nr:MAG: hypothetical protein FD166_3625 [Bacteroidota bacterium]